MHDTIDWVSCLTWAWSHLGERVFRSAFVEVRNGSHSMMGRQWMLSNMQTYWGFMWTFIEVRTEGVHLVGRGVVTTEHNAQWTELLYQSMHMNIYILLAVSLVESMWRSVPREFHPRGTRLHCIWEHLLSRLSSSACKCRCGTCVFCQVFLKDRKLCQLRTISLTFCAEVKRFGQHEPWIDVYAIM